MGAEPGRRFLKQPAAKLEPVIVVYWKYPTEHLSSSMRRAKKCPMINDVPLGRC